MYLHAINYDYFEYHIVRDLQSCQTTVGLRKVRPRRWFCHHIHDDSFETIGYAFYKREEATWLFCKQYILQPSLQRTELIFVVRVHVASTILCISRFSISGAHVHWVGSTDTPSHATKELKCAKGIPPNCGKGLKPRVEHGVTCTLICLVLRSFTVENQLAEPLFLHNASLLCCNKY